MQRKIFYVSDSTARTAELNGESLLSQFPSVEISSVRFPFVDNEAKVKEVIRAARTETKASGIMPIVFSTLVEVNLRALLLKSGVPVIDL